MPHDLVLLFPGHLIPYFASKLIPNQILFKQIVLYFITNYIQYIQYKYLQFFVQNVLQEQIFTMLM